MAIQAQNITILPPETRRGGSVRPNVQQPSQEGFADAVRRNAGDAQGEGRANVDQDRDSSGGSADPRVVRLENEAAATDFSTIEAPATAGQLASGYGNAGAATGFASANAGVARGSVLDLVV